MNCGKRLQGTAVAEKDDEILELKRKLAAAQSARTPLRPESVISTPESVNSTPTSLSSPLRPVAPIFVPDSLRPVPRRGKAPPVDSFSGEDECMRFEDWLPTLVRASTWNGWREDDTLIQLAGHLRGRALQEWNLVPVRERGSYEGAVSALQEKLDPGGRLLAVQDFRHAAQKDQ